MNKDEIIEKLAKMDGFKELKRIGVGWYSVEPDKYPAKRVPDYFESRDAMVPLVEKWVKRDGLEASIARSTKFNYALTGIIERDNPEKERAYGWTYVLVIAATAAQIAEALIDADMGVSVP